MSEQAISKAIQQYLDVRHIYNDRLNAGKVKVASGGWMQLSKVGSPDRFYIRKGQIYFVEVKRPGEKPTKEQVERHQELRNAGAVVIVADSLDSFIKQFTTTPEVMEAST
jgi:hypothetical protein